MKIIQISLVCIGVISTSLVAQEPKITVNYPAGGETFTVGETIRIRWEEENLSLKMVVISASNDLGVDWPLISSFDGIAISDTLWDNFAWTITDDFLGETVMIRVEYYNNVNIFGQSGTFSVVSSQLPIKESRMSKHSNAEISYTTNNGNLKVIAAIPDPRSLSIFSPNGRLVNTRVFGKTESMISDHYYGAGNLIVRLENSEGSNISMIPIVK